MKKFAVFSLEKERKIYSSDEYFYAGDLLTIVPTKKEAKKFIKKWINDRSPLEMLTIIKIHVYEKKLPKIKPVAEETKPKEPSHGFPPDEIEVIKPPKKPTPVNLCQHCKLVDKCPEKEEEEDDNAPVYKCNSFKDRRL